MNWKKRTEWIDDAEKVRAARDPDETALDNARRQQGDTTGAVIEDGDVSRSRSDITEDRVARTSRTQSSNQSQNKPTKDGNTKERVRE